MNSFIVFDGEIKDKKIIDNYMNYVLSQKFGWTPEQIDSLTLEQYEYYFAFIRAENKKQEYDMKISKRKR